MALASLIFYFLFAAEPFFFTTLVLKIGFWEAPAELMLSVIEVGLSGD